MSPARVLVTQRLYLRPATLQDLDALHAMWTDREVRRYLWDDRIIDRGTARETIESSIASFAAWDYGIWVARRLGRSDLIGFSGLRGQIGTTDPEMIYGQLPSAWGHGLATEAAHAVLRYSFQSLGLEVVLAKTDVPNQRSEALMKRLGMRYVGREMTGSLELVVYALRRSEYQSAAAGRPASAGKGQGG